MSETGTSNKSRRIVWAALVPLAVFGVFVVFALMQMLSGRDTSELPSALIGNPVPIFKLKELPGQMRNGEQVPSLASSDLKGKPHLVNIFASWCVPCRVEHPVLMDLAKDERIDIVGINYKDDPGNAVRFLGALGNPYTRIGVDPKGRAAIDWGFYGIPETFLVDADGIVRHKVIGPITASALEDLRSAIDRLEN